MKRLLTSVLLLLPAVTLAVATAARPAGNTGKGFYVAGSALYDPSGHEFRIRGVNRNHWDSYGTPLGLPRSGANTERIVLNFTKPTTYNWGIVSTQMLANGIVPIPGNWTGTCKADPAVLSAIVDTWVAQASTWTQLNTTGLINIANEWGPANSAVWRDSYITAIKRMRAAGYTGTLVVDSGGCGQDSHDIIQYGAAVLASDPQKNILFDVHVYGSFHYPATATWMQDYTTALGQLKATGLPLIIGEFGPGKNIGPSPTMVKPEKVIADAEANGWGWMPWSWDDNNLQNCASDDNGFSMTLKCGTYVTDADLTLYGKTVVPYLKANAAKADLTPPSAGPMVTSIPTSLWCKPNYSCSIQLNAGTATKVTYSLADNDPRISVTPAGLFAWWSKPVLGTYRMTLIIKDSAGNATTLPLTLIVSWCAGKITC